MRIFGWFKSLCLALCVVTATSLSAAEPAFRKDGGDEKLPWYQLKAGEFPPEGSAHAISGELIEVDHIARTGAIRVDRDDSQRTDEYDHALRFTLLPYATLSYHGAPCELRDIPLGTHLHGQFYEETKDNKRTFSLAFRLEDDFSHMTNGGRLWRIDAVDIGKQMLTATGIRTADNMADAKPTQFQLTRAVRVWKGREIGEVKDIAPGQMVLFNLTVCTLKGPGRLTDIWLDPTSREVATAMQVEQHRQYQHEHGLACQVEEVDNQKKIVTVNVFAGFDPGFKTSFKQKDFIAVAVANTDLRTHDQTNDCVRGPIVEVLDGPAAPGQSGLRLRFQGDILIEGFRPGKIVRIFGPGWRVDDLPREERAYDG